MAKLCECGCGGEVTPGSRFIRGHNWRGRRHIEESKRKISEANKGNKHNAKTKRKLSKAAKGRIVSEETKIKLRKARKNRIFTEETKKKISESSKGKVMSEEARRKNSEAKKGIKHTEETKCKMSESKVGEKCYLFGKTGENHPNWKGGSSFLPYCYKFNNTLKEKIRNRDNRTCQHCNAPENGIRHTVHHIHYDKENCYPDLITLCKSCNLRANGNRKQWESYYMNKLNDRGLLNWTRKNVY